MSEQPKPLSAEEESLLRTGAGLFALKESIEREKRGPWCDVVRLFATLDAERARADALNELAEHSGRRADACEVLLEDWQECAGNLALALKNQFHEESRTDEMREALAEFDRLASEATKGVEL